MSSPQAIVNRLLTYSVVDGPGNRLVLFLQGCNFACTTCHNPYTIGSCNDCGICVPVCPTGALKMEAGRVLFEEKLCTQCDLCLDICPISASPMTRLMSVEEVLAIARRHRAFLNGITVSGGEATMQIKFLIALFTAVKADPELSDLTCFVDSNGHLGEMGWQRLLPVTDGVMLDIKAFDPKLHQALTGRGNDRSLRSAQLLHAAGKLHELRFLMIPGRTDSAAELEQLAQFAGQFGDVRVKLNGFRHHGVRGAARQWPVMARESVEAAASFLRSAGFREVVTPAVWV